MLAREFGYDNKQIADMPLAFVACLMDGLKNEAKQMQKAMKRNRKW